MVLLVRYFAFIVAFLLPLICDGGELTPESMKRKAIAENFLGTTISFEENSADHQLTDEEIKRRQKIKEKYLASSPKIKHAWVDVHEMFVPRSEDIPSPDTNEKNEETRAVKAGTDEVQDKINNMKHSSNLDGAYTNYILRWTKKLIRKIEGESDREPVSLHVPFDLSKLSALKEFVSKNRLSMQEMDEFMSAWISNIYVSRKEPFDWDIVNEYLRYLFCLLIYMMAVFSLLALLYFSLRYYRNVTLICLFVVTNVSWHWMHLYYQKKAEKHAQLSSKMPDECHQSDFTLLQHMYEYFKSYFQTNDCAKYYEALMVDPLWEVSLSMAVSEAVTALLLQPLHVLSKSLNSAVKHLFDDLSIFSMFFMVMFLFTLLSMVFKYKIRLPFFFASLEPGQNIAHVRIEPVEIQNDATDVIRTALKHRRDQNRSRPLTHSVLKRVKSDDQRRISEEKESISLESAQMKNDETEATGTTAEDKSRMHEHSVLKSIESDDKKEILVKNECTSSEQKQSTCLSESLEVINHSELVEEYANLSISEENETREENEDSDIEVIGHNLDTLHAINCTCCNDNYAKSVISA